MEKVHDLSNILLFDQLEPGAGVGPMPVQSWLNFRNLEDLACFFS